MTIKQYFMNFGEINKKKNEWHKVSGLLSSWRDKISVGSVLNTIDK